MRRGGAVRVWLLRVWRLAALGTVFTLVLWNAAAQRGRDARPIGLREVQALWGDVAVVDPEVGPLGRALVSWDGATLGHALSTSPAADRLVGYAGPTEVLVLLDGDDRLRDFRIRESADTPGHVRDVADDERFAAALRGRSVAELAGATAEELGIDGVSGATRTSACVVDSIGLRLAPLLGREGSANGVVVGMRDLGLFAVALGGLALAFVRRARRRLRRLYQVVCVVWLGLVVTDLLSWSLFGAWALHGLPWRATPGLAALGAVSLLVPWATGRSVYCAQVCPHGALQEWVGRIAPRGLRVELPAAVRGPLAALPMLSVFLIVGALLVGLPLDLAALEPFDAWLLGAASLASIALAVFTLLASAAVPMAYCRYGCPTGALLESIRTPSTARLGRRDLVLALLLAFAVLLFTCRDTARATLAGMPW